MELFIYFLPFLLFVSVFMYDQTSVVNLEVNVETDAIIRRQGFAVQSVLKSFVLSMMDVVQVQYLSYCSNV